MEPWKVVAIIAGVAFVIWYTVKNGYPWLIRQWWEERKYSHRYPLSPDEGGRGDDMKILEMVIIFGAGIALQQIFRALVPGNRPLLEIGITIVFSGTIYFVIVPAIKRWRARPKK